MLTERGWDDTLFPWVYVWFKFCHIFEAATILIFISFDYLEVYMVSQRLHRKNLHIMMIVSHEKKVSSVAANPQGANGPMTLADALSYIQRCTLANQQRCQATETLLPI